MKAKLEAYPFLTLQKPWTDNANDIWLASTLHLSRNLQHHSFPTKLDAASSQEIRVKLQEALSQHPDLSDPYCVQAEDLGPLEKEFLFEHFLSPHTFQQAMGSEGFVADKEGKIFATINVRDHLQLQITDTKEDLEETYHKLVKIETDIGKSLPYTFSPRFGYLTSDPMQCGTALFVRLYLHVPALIHTGVLEETLERFASDDVEILSIQGGRDEIIGDILTLSNRCTIGLSEEHILQALRAFALKLTLAEQKLRKELKGSKDPAICDEVSRAYGLAVHSYQLETIEAWSALSLLKLGADLEYISNVSHTQLNELLFDCRRAHLVAQYTSEITHEELPHRRAEFIHASLSEAHLEI